MLRQFIAAVGAIVLFVMLERAAPPVAVFMMLFGITYAAADITRRVIDRKPAINPATDPARGDEDDRDTSR